MLSGIKTGKKRKARVPSGPSGPGGGVPTSGKAAIASAAAPFPAPQSGGNRSAAEALRASLGGPPSGGASASSRTDSAADAATSSALNGLERRGRIRPSPGGPDDDTVVVRSAAPSAMDVHEYERKHGVRFNGPRQAVTARARRAPAEVRAGHDRGGDGPGGAHGRRRGHGRDVRTEHRQDGKQAVQALLERLREQERGGRGGLPPGHGQRLQESVQVERRQAVAGSGRGPKPE
ncbi:hypothetical protein THAOC_31547 [Thalassiosira oceanica]|uniref:Uncharacterized protein n=1 Tax=Thalassiosira oceanica TaxID=159749 RepID=K0RL15_THAOC|nr:hypothetical protein THAOC_31547 [Thalassiosira oceanica]|eukprot:EJK49571.1 hypothetical protein THAOC_31547 [Thalassiosira oceanica]